MGRSQLTTITPGGRIRISHREKVEDVHFKYYMKGSVAIWEKECLGFMDLGMEGFCRINSRPELPTYNWAKSLAANFKKCIPIAIAIEYRTTSGESNVQQVGGITCGFDYDMSAPVMSFNSGHTANEILMLSGATQFKPSQNAMMVMKIDPKMWTSPEFRVKRHPAISRTPAGTYIPDQPLGDLGLYHPARFYWAAEGMAGIPGTTQDPPAVDAFVKYGELYVNYIWELAEPCKQQKLAASLSLSLNGTVDENHWLGTSDPTFQQSWIGEQMYGIQRYNDNSIQFSGNTGLFLIHLHIYGSTTAWVKPTTTSSDTSALNLVNIYDGEAYPWSSAGGTSDTMNETYMVSVTNDARLTLSSGTCVDSPTFAELKIYKISDDPNPEQLL